MRTQQALKEYNDPRLPAQGLQLRSLLHARTGKGRLSAQTGGVGASLPKQPQPALLGCSEQRLCSLLVGARTGEPVQFRNDLVLSFTTQHVALMIGPPGAGKS